MVRRRFARVGAVSVGCIRARVGHVTRGGSDEKQYLRGSWGRWGTRGVGSFDEDEENSERYFGLRWMRHL